MTISTTASRISYNGNGSTTAFSFPYRFLTNADLTVIKVAADGTETTLTLNTNYTVTGADDDAGGTVTVSVAPLSGQRLVIYRSVSITQEVDYITGDAFPAETHERALDRLTMVAQQHQDAIDRSAKLSETSTADADTLIANINSLAAIEADVSTVAAIDTDVSAVAAIDTEIAAVVANTTNINAVAANATNINTVATNATAINTNATNITAIQGAAGNASAAQAAQTAAEAARDQTLAVYDSFDDRYLGSKTSDPSVDNDGNALVAGSIYFNSVSGVMRLYTGSAWVAAYVQGVASSIGFTPTGGIAATDVQAAIAEVDSEAAKLAVAQSFTKAQRGAVVALTDGATITPDFSLANNFSVTLGGSRTLANPTNLTAGQSGIITITQDGTGSRTLAYGSYWKFAAGTAPTLTTTASAVDVLAYYVESSTRITARLIGDVK